MGRKNNKNKNKNKFKNQPVQQNQQNQQIQQKPLEKVPVIEVIEPVVEVKQPVVQAEIMKKEKREEMMNQPTEIIGKSSNVEEEVIGKPQVVVNNVKPADQNVQAQQVKPQVNPQPVQTQVAYQQPQIAQQPVYQQPAQPVYQPPVQTVTQKMPPQKVDLLITKNPKSSFSEALKSVRTNLQFAAVEKEIKVVLVSSPEPGDGKSLISSNLAGAYAQENKKVLIIDCDLRKGRQAEIFKIRKLPTMGYTNLILKYSPTATNFKVEDYICKTGVANVDLIPNGPTPPNPIELLSSSKNKELLDELKQKYDLIILDCPPVLGLSDALVMTKYSDANIIVISKGKTKVESLAEVKKSFEKVNSSITGVITNKAKRKHNSYYGYYGE